jgi:hypothetical protein
VEFLFKIGPAMNIWNKARDALFSGHGPVYSSSMSFELLIYGILAHTFACITSRPEVPILPKRGHLRVCPLNIPVLTASDFVANLWRETHSQLGPTSHQMDQSAQGWIGLHESIIRLGSRS